MTALASVGGTPAEGGTRGHGAFGRIGLVIVGTFVALALTAPWIRPYHPDALSSDYLKGPSLRHPLGTNQIGQDLASQMLEGARASLAVAALAGVGTLLLGTAAGLAAAWFRGWVELALMRLVDVLMATPRLPLLIIVGVYAGTDLFTVALVIALVFWPGAARVVRAQVLSQRRRAHVKAAMGFGAGTLHVLRRHVIPEIGLILVAQLLAAAGRAIMLEAGLAFLGVGDESRTSWGSIMQSARRMTGLFYGPEWLWWMLPPIAAITVVLLGLTFLGVAVEQRINPRLTRHSTGRSPA